MRRLAFAALSLAFLATACQPATTELTEEQKAAIADTVNQLHASLTDALNARDADRFFASYSDDMLWGGAYGFGTRAVVEDAVRAGMESSTDAEWDISWYDTAVKVLGPDTAVFWGSYGGGDERTHTTLVYARVDGEWKMVHAHASPAESPPEGY